MLTIAVDTGNKAIKTENLVFHSGLAAMDTVPGEGEEVLYYEGQNYMPTSNRITYLKDKSVDDRYYLLTLLAIGKEIQHREKGIYIPSRERKVDLLVGLPPAHYGAQRKKFREYFFRDGKPVEFSYMNRDYKITFSDVKVYIQGYAAYFLLSYQKKLSTYPKVLLIDIGGITVDYMILRYGRVDRAFMDSLEEGVIRMYQKIKAGIRKKYDLFLEESDIDDIIWNRIDKYDNGIQQRVKEIVHDHVVELLGLFRELGIDFKTTMTVFSGGGSILLADAIEEIWERYGGEYFIVRDEKANAKGYQLQYRAEKGEL